MRVLLITNDYPPRPGGIQQYLSNLVCNSSAVFRVLAPSHHGAVMEDHLVRSDSAFMWPTPGVRDWIGTEIAAFRPDVLVFGAPYPLAQVGPSLSRRFDIPYVVIAHGAEVTLAGRVPVFRRLLKSTFGRAAAVLTVSRYTARRVERLGASHTQVLGAGVDLDTFHPAPSGTRNPVPVIGCISRMVPRKGHLRVLTAAERLYSSGLPVEVLLAGQGRLEDRIRNRASRSEIPVQVVTGPTWEDLPDLYRRCDVFVMPARSRYLGLEIEGLGIVYLEAAATGIPVIAGSSGGAPETVIPGVTGFVATSSVELIEAVRTALDRRDEMGAAARELAEKRFSWQVVSERLDRALRAVITEK
ncbi:MAG: glycosyltransferase family 4 protein [bacterium]|nr:glycosyltransferase family 4 protein [bacterium]MCY3579876.1 glycosyltransferase family 4 protein [bacterium]MDE0643971.1 glycosyltransferase family 4 protein [bacterium]MXX64800.1 glycosyltransferase family 4 protein [Acidimicrobiia bacterium]MYH54610.1 glycosyltransferase family 4 protein [Acidimicrobiia bacterium]